MADACRLAHTLRHPASKERVYTPRRWQVTTTPPTKRGGSFPKKTLAKARRGAERAAPAVGLQQPVPQRHNRVVALPQRPGYTGSVEKAATDGHATLSGRVKVALQDVVVLQHLDVAIEEGTVHHFVVADYIHAACPGVAIAFRLPPSL